MSKNFGTLNAKITANTEDFKANLNKASKEAEGFKQKVTNQLNSIKPSIDGLSGSLAGMFAGLSVAGIVTGFMNITNSIDRLNDVADATGASIEGISRLENIAIATGGSIDDVEGALTKLVSKLNDVDESSGVSLALKSIGLDAEELRKTDPAEALNKVAVALSQYENDANKAQLGTALLGKSYKDLAPFLNDIAENQQMVATVTSQTAAEADRLNKIINGQKLIFSAYQKEMAGNVLPVISDIATAFLNSGDAANTAGGKFQFLTNLIKIAAVAGNELAYIFDITGKEIGVVMAQIAAIGRGDLKGAVGLGGMGDQWTAEAERLTAEKNKRNAAIMAAGTGQPNTANTPTPPKKKAPDYRAPEKPKAGGSKSSKDKDKEEKFTDYELGADYGKAYAEVMGRLIKESQDLDSETQKLSSTEKNLLALFASPEWARMPIEMRQTIIAQHDLNEAKKEAAKAQKEIDDLIAQTPTAKLEEQISLMQRLAVAYEQNKFGIAGSEEAIKKYGEAVNSALGNTAEKSKEAEAGFINLSSALDSASSKMTQSILDFTSGAKTSFGDMAKSFLADIGKMIMQQMIFNALKTGATAMGGSSNSIIAAIGNAFVTKSANGNVFTSGSGGPSLIPFANGGVFDKPMTFPMSGGKTGLAFEAGPEAIMPLTRINGVLGVKAVGAGGNTNVVNQVTVTVNAGSNASADEIGLKTQEAVIRALAKQEIVNATRYGGILNRQ